MWGVALGLQTEVEQVLERTAEDVKHGRAPSATCPRGTARAPVGRLVGGGGGAAAGAPGLMSSSPIPNFGGMMAALGHDRELARVVGLGRAAAGSRGGSSGGGGGGAGGGF